MWSSPDSHIHGGHAFASPDDQEILQYFLLRFLSIVMCSKKIYRPIYQMLHFTDPDVTKKNFFVKS